MYIQQLKPVRSSLPTHFLHPYTSSHTAITRIKYRSISLVLECASNCSTRIEIFAACYTHYTLHRKQLNSSIHNTRTSIIPALLFLFLQSPWDVFTAKTVFCCIDTNKTYTIPYSGVTDFYTIPLSTYLHVSNKSYKCWHVPYFILRSVSVHRKLQIKFYLSFFSQKVRGILDR